MSDGREDAGVHGSVITDRIYSRAVDEVAEHGLSWAGIGVGAGFQAMEHSPDKVEELISVDVPDALFEELLNPVHADKMVHFWFSYGAAAQVMRGMDAFPYHDFSPPAKWLVAMNATLLMGLYKETTDAYIDPMDMAANLLGSYMAYRHHRYRLEKEYGIEDEPFVDLPNVMAEEYLYSKLQRDTSELLIEDQVMERQDYLGKV